MNYVQLGFFILAIALLLMPIVLATAYQIIDRYFARLMDVEQIKMKALIDSARKCFGLKKGEEKES